MNVLIGITGGIAAYKAAILVRLFTKNNHNVKVIMSPMAKEFITPLTLATLSKNPVISEFYNPENGDWNSHVDIGLWADAFVIAPATANTIAKMAVGVANNLLLTTYLSARCPVFFAPTMDLDMFKHHSTQKNIQILETRGNIKIDANTGELASGLTGKGRMAEPEIIYQKVIDFFEVKKTLNSKKIVVTAGPTHEHIDPVRFIGNYSSGKMGYAIAEELANKGAEVTIVSGPVNISTQNKNIKVVDVISAQEMYEQTEKYFAKSDIAVLAAAVADYRPVTIADTKLKKTSEKLNIQLEKTPDIAENIGKKKKNDQFVVGFALETDNELQNATTKLKKKNFDFIVLNSLNDKGAGFNVDTNKITIIKKDKSITEYKLKNKTDVAKDIVEELIKTIEKQTKI